MFKSVKSGLHLLQIALQQISLVALVLFALALLSYTIACAFGLAAWLTLPLTLGDTLYPDAGLYLQCTVTALAVGLCFFLPTNGRIMALENSHRRFHMGMRDVARAYHAAHAADREGVFNLKGEFDSIRERIAFLRDHPDLSELEPSVLELAAQMSHVSSELANTYSDENLARARDFLIARQQEAETFNERIEKAKVMAQDIRHWTEAVEMEEAVAASQLSRLREELHDLVPELLSPQDAEPPAADAAAMPEKPGPVDSEAIDNDAMDEDEILTNIRRLEPRAAE